LKRLTLRKKQAMSETEAANSKSIAILRKTKKELQITNTYDHYT
jgi:hypothetical protein